MAGRGHEPDIDVPDFLAAKVLPGPNPEHELLTFVEMKLETAPDSAAYEQARRYMAKAATYTERPPRFTGYLVMGRWVQPLSLYNSQVVNGVASARIVEGQCYSMFDRADFVRELCQLAADHWN